MSRPDFLRYSVTTLEPGARLVFTHGFRVRPRSKAFFATRPAPIITLGFDVFVQLVIAAITTAPCSRAAVTANVRSRCAAGGRYGRSGGYPGVAMRSVTNVAELVIRY